MTRRDAVELLLRTLLDWQVEPETWTGKLQRRAVRRGLAPHHRAPCPACAGEGVKRDRFRREKPCEPCAGRGWITVDAYTLSEVGTAETATVAHERRALCDRCAGSGVWHGERCPTCDGEGRRTVRRFVLAIERESDEDTLDRALRRSEQREKAGSYAELERCLGALRHADGYARSLIVTVYVLAEGERSDLTVFDREALDRGMDFLVATMPEPIRVPRYAAPTEAKRLARLATRRASEERADALRTLNAQGITVEELAARFGVSRSTVYRVLGGAA